ncbi:MAG: hypothetical protein PVJ76_02005 [Gemmatimonadota bacterium]
MKEAYQERYREFKGLENRERDRGIRLGWIRSVVFSLGFILYLGWDLGSGTLADALGVGALVCVVAFMALVAWHRRVRKRRSYFEAMARINQIALARAERRWRNLPDPAFEEPHTDHPYAQDLDICGQASLLRLFTTVTLPPGLRTLRDWVLSPAEPGQIVLRQGAVAELAPRIDLRQELQVEGGVSDGPSVESIQDFLGWAEAQGWLSQRRWIVWVGRLLPIVTLSTFWLFWRGSLGPSGWLLSLGATFAFASLLRSQIHPLLEVASGGQERFGRYAAILGILLRGEFEAPFLRGLRVAAESSPVGAEMELRRLERDVGWADVRLSPMAHAPLQAFLAWDIHMLERLERWKARSGPYVRGWLEALGALEAVSALASLKADHPEWCFPSVVDGEAEPAGVSAVGLGHPLLSQEACVRNDVEVGPPGTFLFVTGSNMSGKSTLLRALGLNVVLAQAGGPVCARSMEFTPLRVQTSMRTADSLSEGVSQYMAELNRIRNVVDAARSEGRAPVLFLLDEPLQGTNEAERRVAVQTILGHLLDAGGMGAVATHDLQLDDTDRLAAAARAVHLVGTVREGEGGPLLTFDYLLKPGRATSTNALALLRAVGLGRSVGE